MKKGLLRKLFSNRTDRAARLLGAGKGLVHTTLKMKSVVENHVGCEHLGQIGPRGLIQMRINPGRDQNFNLASVTDHSLHKVADHSGGGQTSQFSGRRRLTSRHQRGEEHHSGGENSHACSIGYKKPFGQNLIDSQIRIRSEISSFFEGFLH